jgi:hypothetical protein
MRINFPHFLLQEVEGVQEIHRETFACYSA